MSADPAHAAELRRTAARLAEIGGQTARRFLGKVVVTRKADQSPVTQADHHTQDIILGELSLRYPSHAIVVEETVARPRLHAPLGSSDYCWVVDPIDGTRNFSRGVAIYATSVAVLFRGRPIAGAVYDATTQAVYSASLGGGAWCEDVRLSLDDAGDSRETTIAISSFHRRPVPPAVRGWMDHYLFRNYGAVALHLAWVAAGLVDGAFALECKLWDIAAAALLIEEAGGVVTGPAGNPVWPVDPAAYWGEDIPIVAASPGLHGRLVASLSE